MKDIKKTIKKYQFTKIIIFAIVLTLGAYIVYDRLLVEEDYQQAISHTKVEKITKDEVIISMLSPKTFCPISSTSADVQYISRLIYSRLFTFDENMSPKEDLVEKYSFSGKDIDITLKDAQWHEGGKVTAEDIIFTIEEIKKYGKKGPYFEKVDKIDDASGSGQHLTITFKDANDISTAYLSFPIISKKTYESEMAEDNTEIPQGSGMYKVEKYDMAKEIKCIPNPNFYGEKAKSLLSVKIQKKSSEFSTLVETSNISVYFTNNIKTETEITKENMKIITFPGNSLEFIGFNFKNSIMENGYLRKALVYAMDMNDIRQDYYYNSLIKTDSFFIPKYLETETTKGYQEDFEEANKYLNKANIKDYDGDGYKEVSKGEKISLRILVDKGKKERVETANGLVDAFEDIGIDAEVIAASSANYMDKLKNSQYDLFVGGMTIDETMDFRPLLKTDGRLNYTGFSNQELDEKLDAFMSGNTNEENKEIVSSIKDILHQKIPYYCIGYKKFDVIKAPALEGEIEPNFVNPYGGIENWYCVYEKVQKEETEQQKTEESDDKK